MTWDRGHDCPDFTVGVSAMLRQDCTTLLPNYRATARIHFYFRLNLLLSGLGREGRLDGVSLWLLAMKSGRGVL